MSNYTDIVVPNIYEADIYFIYFITGDDLKN